MPRCVIDLGDIEMSPEAVTALKGARQKVALGHVAGLKYDHPIGVRFPWESLGLIMRRDLERLGKLEREIVAGLGDVRMGRQG